MKRIANAAAVIALFAAVTGCHTLPSEQMGALAPAAPAEGEMLVLNDLYFITDASGSTFPRSEFATEKDLAGAFVGAMPDTYYDVEFISFGGEWRMDWVTMPLQIFDREQLANMVDQMYYIRGGTPLSTALADTQDTIGARSTHAAVVIYSDGMADPEQTLAQAQALVDASDGTLCFHTVHFGNEAEGRALLDALAELGDGCGTSRHAADISSAEGMDQFVRDVFFGPWIDSDGDGVPDPLDLCPDTPAGSPVNGYGCHTWGTIYFDTDRHYVKSRYDAILDEAAALLRNNPRMCLLVEGHTDSRASGEYNEALSSRRANAVAQELLDRGATEGQLIVNGFSEFQPAAPNTNWRNMQLNRRVELRPLP